MTIDQGPQFRDSQSYGRGWNMQTNIKDKVGSQGTLFGGGSKFVAPEHRWPQGYSPARRDEVKKSTSALLGAAAPSDTPEGATEGWGSPRWKIGKRRMLDTLARSTAPASDMKGLYVSSVHPLAREKEWGGSAQSVSGTYRPVTATHLVPSIHVKDETLEPESGSATLLHEVGHHASHLQGTYHSEYLNAHETGAEEGFADRYADTHNRVHPAERRRFPGAVEGKLGGYTPFPEQLADRRAGEHGEQDIPDSAMSARRFQFNDAYTSMRGHDGVPDWQKSMTPGWAERAEEGRMQVLRDNPTLPGLATNKHKQAGQEGGVVPNGRWDIDTSRPSWKAV